MSGEVLARMIDSGQVKNIVRHGLKIEPYRSILWEHMIQLSDKRALLKKLLQNSDEEHDGASWKNDLITLSDEATRSASSRVLSALVKWSPKLSKWNDLPRVVFPFVKLCGIDVELGLACSMVVLNNYFRCGLITLELEPPYQVLGGVEKILLYFEPTLMRHLTKLDANALISSRVLMMSSRSFTPKKLQYDAVAEANSANKENRSSDHTGLPTVCTPTPEDSYECIGEKPESDFHASADGDSVSPSLSANHFLRRNTWLRTSLRSKPTNSVEETPAQNHKRCGSLRMTVKFMIACRDRIILGFHQANILVEENEAFCDSENQIDFRVVGPVDVSLLSSKPHHYWPGSQFHEFSAGNAGGLLKRGRRLCVSWLSGERAALFRRRSLCHQGDLWFRENRSRTKRDPAGDELSKLMGSRALKDYLALEGTLASC
ncbi:unnamed protein product [Notodromas monacha]|uniref:Uncharacterized protein n=1 Tax=Notodromas monacha TaxID=399045 RepID=A0A7R9BWF5_9CRUS|nr:unnamed protein product [Notodromas monacha]CAG0921850.1 unnamed protein product [Notodromas monacha]